MVICLVAFDAAMRAEIGVVASGLLVRHAVGDANGSAETADSA